MTNVKKNNYSTINNILVACTSAKSSNEINIGNSSAISNHNMYFGIIRDIESEQNGLTRYAADNLIIDTLQRTFGKLF